MSDIRSVEKDLEWGIKQEQIVKPRIEEWIEHNLDKTPDYFNIFDFINDEHKIIIEVKSRKNKKNRYPTTMVGDNKWREAIRLKKEGWEVYFFFNFTDCLSYLYFDNQDIPRKRGGRMDRGKREIKYYRYIDINLLHDI